MLLQGLQEWEEKGTLAMRAPMGVAHDESSASTRQGSPYLCEKPLHGALLAPQVAVLLAILHMGAFAGSAKILGHASDCLVFLFKCLPSLQLLEKRTHAVYLITHPETHSLTLPCPHQGMARSQTHICTNYSPLRIYFYPGGLTDRNTRKYREC